MVQEKKNNKSTEEELGDNFGLGKCWRCLMKALRLCLPLQPSIRYLQAEQVQCEVMDRPRDTVAVGGGCDVWVELQEDECVCVCRDWSFTETTGTKWPRMLGRVLRTSASSTSSGCQLKIHTWRTCPTPEVPSPTNPFPSASKATLSCLQLHSWPVLLTQG